MPRDIMRVLAAILFTLSLGVVVGCTTPGKKPFSQTSQQRQKNEAGDRNSDQPWWRDGNQANNDSGRPPRVPQPERLASSDRETIVAGEVVDERDQRRLNGTTFITVRVADQDVPTRRNPGVETDDQGFFYMPGLIPGQTYILTAVREIDGQKMAAEAIVKPPASNVRLVLSTNKVSSLTPTPPPPPGLGPFGNPADSKDRGWEPGSNPPTGGLPPVPVNRNVPVRPENIASGDHDPRRLPTVNIPAPAPAPQPPRQDPPQSRGPGSKVPNFIVSDVMGSDWEFRYASGRLVLLDFWSTSCGPCLRAVPSLKRLQADYGSSGLELIGLACEPDAPFASRAREVELVSRKKEMNYRVYLEREGHVGDVQRLFNVGYYPTLVLLDRSGTILWRGGATDTDLARLEAIVKQNLTKR